MRGCQDQIFSIRQVIEKCYERGKDIFASFVDMEKAFDRIPRSKLFETLRVYGVGEHLITAIQSLYSSSKVAVRIDGELGDWFDFKTGVRVVSYLRSYLLSI